MRTAHATRTNSPAAADRVIFDVGGNLLIETLQDSIAYASKQTSSGFNISICWFFCAGTPVTGSIGASSQTIKHSYLSALGQSGIAAGSSGFDITVKGGTELIGAVLTGSSDPTRNRLTASSLKSRDLDNTQNTKASAGSVTLAYGGGSATTTTAANTTANLLANLDAKAALPKNQNETSQTLSVISPATVTITGSGNAAQDEESRQTVEGLQGRDPATANASLKNTLTLQQAHILERNIARAREDQEAAKIVGAVLANVVGDVAAKMRQPVVDAHTRQALDAKQARGEVLNPTEQRDLARLELAGVTPEKAAQTLADPAALATAETWKDGSPAKIALHGLVGLIEAKIGNGSTAAGALGGISQEAMAPILSKYLVENGFSPTSDEYKSLMQLGASLAGTAIGALSGGTQGAATGATAAFVGVTNNFLKHNEAEALAAAIAKRNKCGGDKVCESETTAEIAQWIAVDKARDGAIASACMSPSSADCVALYGQLLEAQVSYAGKKPIAQLVMADQTRIAQQVGDLGQRIRNATGFNIGAGVTRTASSSLVAMGQLILLAGAAATGDEQAQSDLKKIAAAVGDFLAHPIDTVEKEIKSRLDQASQLEAQGKADEATQIRSQLVSEGLLTATGLGTVAIARSGKIIKLGDNALTAGIDMAYLRSLKLDAGAIKGFKRADEINALMTSAEWLPAWKPGTSVIEATLQPGTKVRMVVDETVMKALTDPTGKTDISRAFGGWATFDDVSTQSYARKQLAITKDMKARVDYVIEVEITKPMSAQVGIVGAQNGASGGGNQLHFLVDPSERSSAFKYVAGSARILP